MSGAKKRKSSNAAADIVNAWWNEEEKKLNKDLLEFDIEWMMYGGMTQVTANCLRQVVANWMRELAPVGPPRCVLADLSSHVKTTTITSYVVVLLSSVSILTHNAFQTALFSVAVRGHPEVKEFYVFFVGAPNDNAALQLKINPKSSEAVKKQIIYTPLCEKK